MKAWVNLFRVILLIMGIAAVVFVAQLYAVCKQQNIELNSVKDKLDAEAEFNSNKFKYQADQIDRLSKDLDDAQQQMKNQNDSLSDQKDALAGQRDALLQEVQKRQQVENENKGIQTSLVDIKAEADAIKQDMKSWQKDYVGVLAQLNNGIVNIQGQIKNLHDNVNSLNIPELNQKIDSLEAQVELAIHPPANDSADTAPAPEKDVEHVHYENQP